MTASRINGGKASNKGEITAAKVKVICAKVQWRRGDPAVTFETKFRAKLHKKTKYKDQAEAEAWAQAAFLIASLPAHNASALTHGLGYAAAYGFFIVGTAQAAGKEGQPMAAAQLAQLTADYKCHTNWVGVVLGAVELVQVHEQPLGPRKRPVRRVHRQCRLRAPTALLSE